MKLFYVYIVKCSDDSYYTGITNDIERRVIEHSEGISPSSYTFKRRPVQLVFYETFNDFKIAEQWEKRLKGWSRRKKEALIEKNWEKLKEYSVCRNDSHFSNFKMNGQIKEIQFDSAHCDKRHPERSRRMKKIK